MGEVGVLFEESGGEEVGDAVGDGCEDFGGLVFEEGVEFVSGAAGVEVVFVGVEGGVFSFIEGFGVGGGGGELVVVLLEVVEEFALVGLGFFIEVDECVDGELVGAEEAFAVDAFGVVIEVGDGGVGAGFEGGFPLGDVIGVEVWGDPPGFLVGVPTGAEGFGFIFVFKGDGDIEAVIAAGGEEGGLKGVRAPGGGGGGVEAEVEEEVFEEGAEDFFLF